MKTDLIIREELADLNSGISSSLSFKPFFDYLSQRTITNTVVKEKIYQFILDQFELHPDWKNEIVHIRECSFLYELIFGALLSPMTDEQEIVWGLSLPISPATFYSTDRFYNLIKHNVHQGKHIVLLNTDLAISKRRIEEGAYALILQRLYHLPVFPVTEVMQGYQEVETGLMRYMRIELDFRFTNVTTKIVLPEINIFLPPSGRLDEQTHHALLEKLPLSQFHFDGFSIINGEDGTESFVLELIREAMTVDNPEEMGKVYPEIFKFLQSLLGTTQIELSILPFIEVNDKLVFAFEGKQLSYLSRSAQHAGFSEDDLLLFLDQFKENPSRFFHTTQQDADTTSLPFKIVLSEGIKSLVLLPIHYHGTLIGIFELYSTVVDISDRRLLARLNNALLLLSQLVHRTVTEGTAYIDRLVKEQFTSLQPAVEWKFKELAWQYIKDCRIGNQQYEMSTVHFREVYPLYGAIDIRNSTLERNSALRKDFKTQLDVLQLVLSELRQMTPEQPLLLKMQMCKMFRLLLDEELTTECEVSIPQFLDVEIPLFLNTLATHYPVIVSFVTNYLKQARDTNGYFFINRNGLEKSIQLINRSLAAQLHLFHQRLLEIFPNYFESFRTDGVEYDIYLGQSIAPLSAFHLNW